MQHPPSTVLPTERTGKRPNVGGGGRELGEQRGSSWTILSGGYSPDKKHLAKRAEVGPFASPHF
jgi:hypothetical protein